MKTKLYILLALILSATFLNASDLRVELEELSKNTAKYKILDVREPDAFELGHIEGALNFPVNLTYEHKQISGKIVQPNKMQKIARDLGIDVNDQIVIYDYDSFFDTARLFWTLEVYGFKKVKLLNSGLKQWEEKGLPTSSETLTPKKSKYISSINHKRLATKFTTQIATRNPNQTIIDARDYKSYIGEKSSAKRFGHIPEAIHIPAIHNIDEKEAVAKLKTTDDLGKLYEGVKKDKKVIIYCAIGRIASTNYFALRELGYDVSNYDASWKEWGNDLNLPIETKSKK